MFRQSSLRAWSAAVLVGAGALVAAAFSGRVAYERGLTHQTAEARRTLQQRAEALDSYIDRYRIMPAVLALDPQLEATLENPADAGLLKRANERLEQLNFSNRTSTLTLIDRRGLGVAASNWREAKNNVGHAYDFRPYFADAMATGDGEFYAVGIVTEVPGYFIARAIRDAAGKAIGVVSVKVDLAAVQAEWANAEDIVLLSDANGVVFLAGRPAWRYRSLAPLSAAQRADLQRTHQYLNRDVAGVALQSRRDFGADARLVDVVEPVAEHGLLFDSLALPREGWTLHSLSRTRASVRAGWTAAAVGAGAWLLLVLLAVVVLQRFRIMRLKLRGERELKRLVEHHAQALRHAQDGVLEAAREAALGQGSSLDHLPQGVSVVDRHLDLVAWNRRYAELFRYPPDLLRAGRPIADLIRYNAQRGLLGADGGEEAVERRLARLRAGQPHLHERVAPDGTVIEIRGTPLPDGGFVTSYVDITAYRQAARDLRSMVESLEVRIRQRTHDLQIASNEAERANRAKTRLVAAAVHDLLQPLNAARLYLSTLRRHITPGGEALVGHVDAALGTQENILSSLLDISRLESGTFEVHRATLPLGDLFTSLQAQFAPHAAARGLRLDVVATRATIASDAVLLHRVVQNFLSNALKFTAPAGRVVLGARRLAGRMRIEVWDTGPGIAENQRERIFEEFQRLDSGRATKDPAHGAGLGLAIVRHIARVLDHAVAVRSWPGRGSVFSIDVPFGATVEPRIEEAADESEETFRDCVVWIVDDDAHSSGAAQTLLQAWGCRTRSCSSAAQALDAGAHRPMPELLLLDYRLGETTGFELAARLRERWGALPPVVLVSGDAYSDLRTRCRELGWGFLPKPLRPAALRALMSRTIEATAAAAAATS